MAAILNSLDHVAMSMTASSSNPKSAVDEAIEEAIKTILELPDEEMDQDKQVRVFQLFHADKKIAVFFQMMVAWGKLQIGLAYLQMELKNIVE
ncbi:hypothetical protein Moror_2081 [Moniliophthora roreri MCA 2997]|nr:hypothetical protein Moror_2081 [Moniliophthora roreri MCA 2997]